MYMCIYIYIYLYLSIYLSIYLYLSLYIYIYMYIYIYIYTHIHIYIYIFIYIHTYIHIYIYIYIYIYIFPQRAQLSQDEGDLPSGQGIRQSAVPVSSPTASRAMMDMNDGARRVPPPMRRPPPRRMPGPAPKLVSPAGSAGSKPPSPAGVIAGPSPVAAPPEMKAPPATPAAAASSWRRGGVVANPLTGKARPPIRKPGGGNMWEIEDGVRPPQRQAPPQRPAPARRPQPRPLSSSVSPPPTAEDAGDSPFSTSPTGRGRAVALSRAYAVSAETSDGAGVTPARQSPQPRARPLGPASNAASREVSRAQSDAESPPRMRSSGPVRPVSRWRSGSPTRGPSGSPQGGGPPRRGPPPMRKPGNRPAMTAASDPRSSEQPVRSETIQY